MFVFQKREGLKTRTGLLEIPKTFVYVVLFFVLTVLPAACSKPAPDAGGAAGAVIQPGSAALPAKELPELDEAIARLSSSGGTAGKVGGGDANLLTAVLTRADLPPELVIKLEAKAAESPAFVLDLLGCLEGDPFLRRLVDKNHALPAAYEPDDLVELKAGGSYSVSRKGMLLRRAAADSLEEMAAAAKPQGVSLVVSSAYRSCDYQAEVYSRIVKEMGQAAADRESARPGRSQHQTGLAADFGSIDDSFAGTAAGRWMAANAGRFGWSLSFPDGYEDVTGYRWESWHYRYVGRDLAAFIENYFGGIQQYALQFIHAWEAESGE
ncbi:MAG: M15 family metallopeptidase [Treponema sp.]|jgi:D-alanyl-D-alanine carboxypeptidase|nr:M15 family metallopeptidase [Treponema sp.]